MSRTILRRESIWKNVFFLKYTKPDAMDSIKTDIVRYNKIKCYAFSLIVKMGVDKPLSDGTSIHNHLKDKFDVNDHFANAAKREAVASYKSAMECLKLNAETLESKIKQEDKKLSFGAEAAWPFKRRKSVSCE